MEMTKTITVYFEDTDKEVDIEVDCEYEILNDGIGWYEYWGSVGFDKGRDYIGIYSTEWNKIGFTPEEIAVVEAKIEEEKENWVPEDFGGDDDFPDREDE